MRNQLFQNLRKALQHFIYFCFHLTPQLGKNFFFFFCPNSIHPYCKSNKQIRKCSSQQSVFPYVGPWPLVLEGAEQTLPLRTESVCSDQSEHSPKDWGKELAFVFPSVEVPRGRKVAVHRTYFKTSERPKNNLLLPAAKITTEASNKYSDILWRKPGERECLEN